MPSETNSNYGYDWELTRSEASRVFKAEIPEGWEKHRITPSGFFMFVNEGREEMGWQEAGIGPTDEGDTRSYVATEQEDGTYKTEERYEGSFSKALENLVDWMENF